MNRKIYFIGFLMGIVITTAAQDYFSKIIDLNNRTDELILNFSLSEDGLYSGIGSLCNNSTSECAVVAEFNANGDTLWTNRIEWLDPGARAIDKLGDTLLMAGHTSTLSHFYLHYMDLQGDSLTTLELFPPEGYYEVRIAGIFQYQDYIIVFGTSRKEDSETLVSLLHWVNSSGVLDTSTVLAYTEERTIVYDMDEDPEGNLTLMVNFTEWTEGPFPYVIRRKKLVKYNSAMEEVWSWQTNNDYTFTQENISRLEVLSDGTMIIIAEDNSTTKEEIWGIGEFGVEWKYSFPLGGSNRFQVINLTEASNGDILGCGQIRDGMVVDGENGYLFRMSPEGEMLWDKIIIDNANEVSGYDDFGRFLDVVELDDGSILAGGYQVVWYKNALGEEVNDWDLWLVRTNADGCIIEDCDYVQDIPTSIPVFANTAAIDFYPNPTSDFLNISWPAELTISRITIFNAMGQVLQTIPITAQLINLVNVEELPAGLYYVSLQDREGRSYTEKIVVNR